MAIVQCPCGHYFDDTRNDSCPYCEKYEGGAVDSGELNEQLTSYYDFGFESGADDGGYQLTEAYGEEVEEYERTIGIFTEESGNVLTVGWLVCMCGPMKGKSYTVHSGRNFAGRSFDMDIVLSDDGYLSRENHFSVVYDPRGKAFYLVAGEGQSYLNGEAVTSQCELGEGDVIRAGMSEYIFVPFCKEGRDWD